MKIVIACLNSKYIHASLSPWCLAAGIESFAEKEYDVKVLESTINADVSEFAEKIEAENPDIISLSCYIWNIKKTLELCRKLRNFTIVLGGPEVAYRPRNVLENYPYIDFILSGEGEWELPHLLDTLNTESDLKEVTGLTFRNGGKIISVESTEQSDTPPSPYSEEFFEKLNGRITYIEASRGCPYRCAFCLSGRCSPLRFFDLDRVKEDIIRLANSKTQTVKFVDRTFNANSKRANEILEFIKENYGTKIPDGACFHFEIAGDILTEETMHLLSLMPKGLIQLEIGMQSFNEETLKVINRKTNIKKLIENIKRLISFNNMHIHIDLIAGLTGEDIESFENSFNTGYSLKANMLQLGFLKLLYGADMRENPEKYPCKFNDEAPYEVTETPWLSQSEILMLKKTEDALERLYNSGRFLFTLDYLINDAGFIPFRLFRDFGAFVDGNGMKLSDYAERVYFYFKDKCDAEILREKIVCDLLSCSSALQIPEDLKIKDENYKKIKKHFIEKYGNRTKIAILYKSKQIFVVNQNENKDLQGRYKGKFYELNEAL